MSRYVPTKLRKQVAERANFCCEYGLFYEPHAFIKFQIEHIISLKHGGKTLSDNLAYSCFYCNNSKGTDLGTNLDSDEIIRFFNPRKDDWLNHFELSKHLILPKSAIAKATIKILGVNGEERLEERLAFYESGNYPHDNARKLIGLEVD